MKILLSAYACDPNRGSEPGVGWHIARHLAESHDVWVATRRKNRQNIERSLATDPAARLRFVYHDLDWALPLKRRIPGSVYPYHYAWQLSLAGHLAELHKRERFDVVHTLTLGSFRFPASLQHLGPPSVLGPLGGLEEAPIGFWPRFGPAGLAKEALRWSSNRFARVDPLVRATLQSTDAVLAASRDGRDELVRHFDLRRSPVVLPSIGIDRVEGPRRHSPRDDLRLLFVGRLEHWKGTHLAIDALSLLEAERVPARLTILGSGPRSESLQRLARQRRVSNRITWITRLPSLDDVHALYREHDVLVFPSLHESGGMVAVEAMAAGLPVVCIAIGGPAVTVTEDVGYAIRASNSKSGAQGIANAVGDLVRRPRLLAAMGEEARRRAAHSYTWSSKVARLCSLYEELA